MIELERSPIDCLGTSVFVALQGEIHREKPDINGRCASRISSKFSPAPENA